ncbi:MAG: hypothetical protein R2880_02660 [Deinococcales bacterium]
MKGPVVFRLCARQVARAAHLIKIIAFLMLITNHQVTFAQIMPDNNLPPSSNTLQGTMIGTASYQGVNISMSLSFVNNDDPNSHHQCPLWSHLSTLYGAQWLCSYVEINALARQIRYVAQGEGIMLQAFLTERGLEGQIDTLSCSDQGCQQGHGSFLVNQSPNPNFN